MVFGYRTTRHPFHQFRDEVDRLLTGVLRRAADGLLPGVFRSQPAINVWEQNDALKVEMELPGVKSEQLDISVAGGELSVKVNAPTLPRRTSPTIDANGRSGRSAASCGCRSKSTPIGSRPIFATAC